MTGEFNRLLSGNEMGRFDAALKGLSATSFSALKPAQSADTLEPSVYEQQVWLCQQQQPELVLRRVLAYRLSGEVDGARLVSALQTLVRTFPDLAMRYRFDDDGDLRKLPTQSSSQCIEIVAADDVTDLIQARQAAPWNSEEEPPFKALVIPGKAQDKNGNMVLALLIHHILDETCPADALLLNLAAAYHGSPLHPTAANRPAIRPVGMTDPVAPVAWIRSATSHPAALRYTTGIAPEAFAEVASSSSQDGRLWAVIAAQFSCFVCHLGGHDRIGLLLSRDGEAIRPLTVAGDLPTADAVSHILAHLNAAQPLDAANLQADLPTVSVTWHGERHRSFALDGVRVERLTLPTLEICPDLALDASVDTEGNITLELTTGQAVSSHIGAFLLEHFVAFMGGAPTRQMSAAIAPAPTPQASADKAVLDVDAIAALILSEFREALGAPTMGLNDDFFDHGGHSLIATRIIGRLLGTHGLEVHFNDLFSNPTAASLARHATVTAPVSLDLPGQSAGDDGQTAPLALAQMSLWKAYAAFGYGEIFNLPFALDFIDPVDEAVFERAFLDILERHHGLRTLFFQKDGAVLQKVVPMADMGQYKWFWTSAESEGVDRHMEAGYHFDLEKELPLRLRFLIDPASGHQVLSFLFHHIVLDEWSVNLMMDELAKAYQARALGQAPVWSTTPAPFLDFARRQNTDGVNADHLAYWTDMLRDAPKGLALFERDTEADHVSAEVSAAGGWVEFKLERDVTEGLYALAKHSSASLFNIVYAAISASLYKIGNLSDLVIGTSASGRTDHSFFDTVGYFTTVVAHRVRFRHDMSLGDLIAAVKTTVNESMPYSGIPIDLVEEALGMTPGRDHLFSVFIQIHAKNKLNGSLPSPEGKSIEFRQVDPERHESMLGLHFEVMEEMIGDERSIRVLMSYRAAEYGPEQVEQIKNTTNAVFTLFASSGASEIALADKG
ncbi:hypothetical protein H4S14_000178 [Agrobacterium vitis]|nr:hypothetical protein [Agrobacterium vitis]MBE1436451.1 hypothetical protein [Agrobacterium vitis]